MNAWQKREIKDRMAESATQKLKGTDDRVIKEGHGKGFTDWTVRVGVNVGGGRKCHLGSSPGVSRTKSPSQRD